MMRSLRKLDQQEREGSSLSLQKKVDYARGLFVSTCLPSFGYSTVPTWESEEADESIKDDVSG